MEMRCKFDYCILDEIQMNGIGMCDSCITVAISEENLEEYKNNQLLAIMSGYKNYEE